MLEITLGIKPAANSVSITLGLVNNHASSVYAFTKLWTYGEDGAIKLDELHVYSSLGANGEILFGKIILRQE